MDGSDPTTDGCVRLNQRQDRYTGLVTSQFLHADVLHLALNMLFLWVFGNNIEDRLGRLHGRGPRSRARRQPEQGQAGGSRARAHQSSSVGSGSWKLSRNPAAYTNRATAAAV